jgi:hypothetical protein
MNHQIFAWATRVLWALPLLFAASTAVASVCQRDFYRVETLTRSQQVQALQSMAERGCALMSVRFVERSRGSWRHSQVVLDLHHEQLIRSIERGPVRHYYAWQGVARSALMRADAAVGFENFTFIGRATRGSMSRGVRDLLP